MIFGPNESSRRDLFLENFSNERNERSFRKIRKFFKKKFKNIFGKILAYIREASLNGRLQHLLELAKRGRLDQMLFFRRR